MMTFWKNLKDFWKGHGVFLEKSKRHPERSYLYGEIKRTSGKNMMTFWRNQKKSCGKVMMTFWINLKNLWKDHNEFLEKSKGLLEKS